jgi:hypothetical protein
MDFILFSALFNTIFLFLIISYDIACQYSKNFWTQMAGLPEAMHIDPAKVSVWFKVPNFHILGHKWLCHSPFSFHWMWGAGMTDGEDVEQNWDFTNGAAGSTKMMGPGGRHAFLEGLFAFHNWMRTVSYRKVFGRRLGWDLKEGKQPLDPVGLFKKAMLSTGQAFCKKPWYLSNSPKRRNKRKRMAGIEPKNPCMMAIILAMPLTTTLSKL